MIAQLPDLLPAFPLLGAAVFYLLGVTRLARRRINWPWQRSAAFVSGLMLVAIAVLPPIASRDEYFPVHIVQHLLLGMAAPLLFALSAPMTLLLRVLPPARRRPLARLLHRRVLRWLSHPIAGALLAVGSMYVLYLTPLYAATLRHPLLHAGLHAHFLLAGYLLSWSLVGLDPVPRRASLAVRAAVLVLTFGSHDILAKFLYAQGPGVAGLAATATSLHAWQLGAEIMWYGGDIVDVALTIVLFHQWYRAGGRRLERIRRPDVTVGIY